MNEIELQAEIRAWSVEVLEEPKDDGHATCPYAKKTWQDEKVKIIKSEKSSWEDLVLFAKRFPRNIDVCIYCDFNTDEHVEVFDAKIQMMNTFFNEFNLWIMGFHQDHEEKTVVDQESFEPLFEESYNMIFMQRLDTLNIASERLEKIGYYDSWNEEEFEQILQRRSV